MPLGQRRWKSQHPVRGSGWSWQIVNSSRTQAANTDNLWAPTPSGHYRSHLVLLTTSVIMALLAVREMQRQMAWTILHQSGCNHSTIVLDKRNHKTKETNNQVGRSSKSCVTEKRSGDHATKGIDQRAQVQKFDNPNTVFPLTFEVSQTLFIVNRAYFPFYWSPHEQLTGSQWSKSSHFKLMYQFMKKRFSVLFRKHKITIWQRVIAFEYSRLASSWAKSVKRE